MVVYQRGTISGDGLQVAAGVMTMGTVNTTGPGGFGLRSPDYFEIQGAWPFPGPRGRQLQYEGVGAWLGVQGTTPRYGDVFGGAAAAASGTSDRASFSVTGGWLQRPDLPFGIQPNRDQLNDFLVGQSEQFTFGVPVEGVPVPVGGGATWNGSGVALNLGIVSLGPTYSRGQNPDQPNARSPLRW